MFARPTLCCEDGTLRSRVSIVQHRDDHLLGPIVRNAWRARDENVGPSPGSLSGHERQLLGHPQLPERDGRRVTAVAFDAAPLCFGHVGLDPHHRVDQIQRILFAARMSANEQKLRALGGLLGGVVAARGDHLDEASVLVTILSDIEAPQVVTLDVLCGDPPDADEQRRDAAERGMSGIEPTWLVSQVQAELPIAAELALACLSDLVRHGLAETASLYGVGFRYRITAFGRSFAAIMTRAAEQPQQHE